MDREAARAVLSEDPEVWRSLVLQWESWPAFLSQAYAPVFMIVAPWYVVLGGVLAVNTAWTLAIRNRWWSHHVYTVGGRLVQARWITCPAAAVVLWSQGRRWEAALALCWVLVAFGIMKLTFPSQIEPTLEYMREQVEEPGAIPEAEGSGVPGVRGQELRDALTLTIEGLRRSPGGGWPLEFTDEEVAAIEIHMKLISGFVQQPEMELWVDPRLHIELGAQALWYYGQELVKFGPRTSPEREDALRGAAIALLKSQSILPAPFVLYLASDILERLRMSESRELLELFVKQSAKFKPSRSQRVLIDAMKWDEKSALRDARHRLGAG